MSTEHNLKPGTVVSALGDRYTVCEPIPGENLHAEVPQNAITVTFKSQGHEYADYLYPEEIDSVVSTPDPEPSGFNVELAYLAAKYGRTLVFKYAKGRGGFVLEQRRLQPEAVTTTKDGAVVIIGNDLDRDDVRAYRVDRIKGDASIA